MTVDRISPDEALRWMRELGYRYLDVRSEVEFELGHPEGAYNLPWQHDPAAPATNPEFIAVAERAFAKDAQLIVGCRSNRRSAKAIAALAAAGFTRLAEQRAGMDGTRDPFGGVVEAGWQALGLPVSMHALPGHGYAELRAHAHAAEAGDLSADEAPDPKAPSERR